MLGLIEDPVWNQMMEVVQGRLAEQTQRHAIETAISAKLESMACSRASSASRDRGKGEEDGRHDVQERKRSPR